MLLFSTKNAFNFPILRIKEGLSHVQNPLSRHFWCGCTVVVKWWSAIEENTG